MKNNLVSEFFPNGLRVMVVDNDERFLKIAKAMLISCNYKVMTCKNPIVALSILEEHQEEFDLLLAEMHMQEMNGIQLLDIVHGELEIPVVLMCADTSIELVMKIFMHGASFFIPKPLDMILVKSIWKHSAWNQVLKEEKLKKPDSEKKKKNKEKNAVIVLDDDNDDASANTDKRKGKRIATSEDIDVPEIKRQRLIWTSELEEKFQYAMNKLGKDAVPRKILSIMNVEGVDRQHVASHLQKHKLRKQKAEKVAEVVSELSTSLASGNFPDKFRQFSANPNPNPNPNPIPNLNPNPQASMPQTQPQQHMMASTHPMCHISHVEECLNKLSNNNSNAVQPSPNQAQELATNTEECLNKLSNNNSNAVQPSPNQAQELATNTEDVGLPSNSDDFMEFINLMPDLPADLINDDLSWLNGDFSLSPQPTGAAGDDLDVGMFLSDEVGSYNMNDLQAEEERNGANYQVPFEPPMDFNQFENLGFLQQKQQQNEVGSSSNGGDDDRSFTEMMRKIISENDDLSYMRDGFPTDDMF